MSYENENIDKDASLMTTVGRKKVPRIFGFLVNDVARNLKMWHPRCVRSIIQSCSVYISIYTYSHETQQLYIISIYRYIHTTTLYYVAHNLKNCCNYV